MKKGKEFFLKKAIGLSSKSGCLRAKAGGVWVKKNKVILQAYNQVFPRNSFCQDKGCLRDKLKLGLGKEAEKCRSIHAEALAVSKAARKGISLRDTTAYLTYQPCINCAKLLYVAGVKRVYFIDRRADVTGNVFLNNMGIPCQQVRLSKDNPQKRLRDISGQK